MTDDGSRTDLQPRDSRTPAEAMLSDEFATCSAALAKWQDGHARMSEGQHEFDRLWTGIIKNAVRLFGKDATRDALTRMGRREDVTKMY